jgi:hypothetical protein
MEEIRWRNELKSEEIYEGGQSKEEKTGQPFVGANVVQGGPMGGVTGEREREPAHFNFLTCLWIHACEGGWLARGLTDL